MPGWTRFAFVLMVAASVAAFAAIRGGAPAPAPKAADELAVAIFAGGCFWCTEADFDHVQGVLSTRSGYTGGRVPNPTYEQVSAGGTGHIEAVRVTYDPRRVSYAQLARHFFRTIDPLDAGGQFCDRGDQYRSALFVANDAERAAAEAARADAARQLGARVATQILPRTRFWPAEAYHQDYYRRNPVRYRFYRWNCGREQRIREIWPTTR